MTSAAVRGIPTHPDLSPPRRLEGRWQKRSSLTRSSRLSFPSSTRRSSFQSFDNGSRRGLAEIEGGHEIVLVDDGSTDSSPELIEAWAASDERVVLVQLSRNFGMEIAMSAGLDHARGPFTAIMHADLRTRRS